MENIRQPIFQLPGRLCGGLGLQPGFGLRMAAFGFLLLPLSLAAQTPPQLPPGGLMQLQVAQPAVDVTSPVSATAAFDPPVAQEGEKTYYRVSVDATESSIQWPDEISAPAGLEFGSKASGQLTQMQGGRFRPLASFVYEVKPRAEGHFTVAGFSVDVAGTRVEIPAASLEVVSANTAKTAARQLRLEVLQTNVFLGQPFRARVILPTGPNDEVEALREIELHGEGLMVDKTTSQQVIGPFNLDGQLKMAFASELVVTPIAAGPLKFFAQGFTAGREFTAPISIHGRVNFSAGLPKYVFLVSDPVTLNVRPLPVEDEPPSFTGAIGRFFYDPPSLATNRLQVGGPVRLRVTFHGDGELARFVPPTAPLSRDWDVIADPPPATSFTLIPLADDLSETPAIPFSYFDPDTEKYVDLTVPPMPVTVVGEGLPMALPGDAGKTAAPVKLSALAPVPGQTLTGLTPLQLRACFAGWQLAPLAGFIALWQWDRRRRFLEAHPDIVRRARARRGLRRARRRLEAAVAAQDPAAFVLCAAEAMTIAVAPHFPANPKALVCGDVLAQLDSAGENGQSAETVRKLFAAADSGFAATPQMPPDLLALCPGVERVLQKLEEKL
ncbi:MAG: hypothetical protein ABSH48_10410 [Verrucomicrobiota bacterium]